ncbi:MAG TPA: hypothetical protein VGD80_32795 [Kofleriaceae bacterium]
MNTTPNNKQTSETATDAQDTTTVASIKLDDVTGGWWGGPGPYGNPYAAWGSPWGGPGPYGNPYAAARFAAFENRAAWYAANTPAYRPWWY